jgi:hypothetical protein
VSEDLRPIVPYPDEIIGWECDMLGIRPAEEVRGVTRFFQYLHESPGVTERVKIHGCPGFHTKFFFKVRFTHKNLPDKRFSAGHVAIWLEIPTAQDMPFLLLHQLLDSGKNVWLKHLDPFIQDCFIVVEHEFIEFLTKLSCGPKGRESFAGALFPLPQPDRIEMGITDEIQSLGFHFVLHSIKSSRQRNFHPEVFF